MPEEPAQVVLLGERAPPWPVRYIKRWLKAAKLYKGELRVVAVAPCHRWSVLTGGAPDNLEDIRFPAYQGPGMVVVKRIQFYPPLGEVWEKEIESRPYMGRDKPFIRKGNLGQGVLERIVCFTASAGGKSTVKVP